MIDQMREQHQVTPWIENLPYNWDALINVGKLLKVRKHSIIFVQGEKANAIYLVVSGRIRLFLNSPSGEEKALAIIGKNGLFGEYCTNGHQTNTTNAISASNAVLYQINIEQFRELLKQDFQLVEQLLLLENLKYRLLCFQSLQLSYTKAPQRICASLIHLALNYGDAVHPNCIKIMIEFTHQEMANLVGTTRITVVKTFRWLENNQLIEKQDKLYIINNMRKLQRLVEDEEWKIN